MEKQVLQVIKEGNKTGNIEVAFGDLLRKVLAVQSNMDVVLEIGKVRAEL